MFAVPIFDTLQSHRIAPSGTEDETEKGPLLMGRTSVSCDSLGAVEGAGQVILEADHAETFPCSPELLQKWLKKILIYMQGGKSIQNALYFRILSDLVLLRNAFIFSSLLVGV